MIRSLNKKPTTGRGAEARVAGCGVLPGPPPEGRDQASRAQASEWLPPSVTATPCGSAHSFQWGCCYLGCGPVPTEKQRQLPPSRPAATSSAVLPGPGWQRVEGRGQAAETECTGL